MERERKDGERKKDKGKTRHIFKFFSCIVRYPYYMYEQFIQNIFISLSKFEFEIKFAYEYKILCIFRESYKLKLQYKYQFVFFLHQIISTLNRMYET